MEPPTGEVLEDTVTELTTEDTYHLRAVIERSWQARRDGSYPFAATVVDENGTVLSETTNNSTGPDGDPTQHAELLAVTAAVRWVGVKALSRVTLYTNVEPCAMCAAAAYWAGVGRVVYALSEKRLHQLTGDHPGNPTMALPCREVFSRGQRAVTVIGPHLQEEAASAHDDFWR